jgi:hypothetical protein
LILEVLARPPFLFDDELPEQWAVSKAVVVFRQRWERDSNPLRVLTGSIDKIIKWESIRESAPVHFEVIGE